MMPGSETSKSPRAGGSVTWWILQLASATGCSRSHRCPSWPLWPMQTCDPVASIFSPKHQEDTSMSEVTLP